MVDEAEAVIVRFEERHRKEIISLWQSCGLTRAWNVPDKDIDRKLSDPQGGFFVLLQVFDSPCAKCCFLMLFFFFCMLPG